MAVPFRTGSIRFKLIFANLLAPSLFLGIFIASLVSIRGAYGELVVYQQNQESIFALSAVMDRAAAGIDNHLLSGNAEYLDTLRDELDRFAAATRDLERRLPRDFRYRIRDLRSMAETFADYARSAAADLAAGKERIYVNRDRADLVRLKGFIQEESGRLLSSYMEHTRELIAASRSDLERNENLAYLGAILGALTAAGIALRIAAEIADPLHLLSETALKVAAGDLDTAAPDYPKRDELGVLVDSFNTMTVEIRNLVRDLQEKASLEVRLREERLRATQAESSLRKTELELLQARINPHFLFNTLSAVSALARAEEAPNTRVAVESVSSIMRYTLSKRSGPPLLEEEMALVRNYLYLQSLRFGKRLSWVADMDEDCAGVTIPAFSIQPFVENAVLHGIEPKEEGGSVQIYASVGAGENSVEVVVRDDGVGMAAEKVAELQNPSEETLSRHMGVANVARRLELILGYPAVSIESEPGKGTIVRITLPYPAAGDRLPG